MTDGAGRAIKLLVDKSKRLNVHYLEDMDINVGIENQDPRATVVIDSLALRFQSRSSPGSVKADPRTTVVHPGGGLSIPPAKLNYYSIPVCPNLLFLKYTNIFDIVVGYRLSDNIVGRQSFVGEGWWVLIQPAPQLFGKVFISYKEPEDRPLADLLFEFARDAGFEPYMAPPDIRTGSRIWGKKIPAAIKASKFVFVIWTRKSLKGQGIKKEIKIARENGIQLVPLLEKKAPAPGLFGRDLEYTRFDSENPATTFADVVAATRRM